jgi:thiamine monophosphate synthase
MKSSESRTATDVPAVPRVRLGSLQVSRLIIGGNMFSGFSHVSPAKDVEMMRYYTTDRIKATLRRAEALGINTFIGRADRHVMRLMREYRDEGGSIQWIAQTASELLNLTTSISFAIDAGASAVYLHGGKMDWLHAGQELDQAVRGVEQVRQAGLPVGVASHRPPVLAWAEAQKLDVDFYMCSYYDPTPRTTNPMHDPAANETYDPADRQAMVAAIAALRRPAIHYKVLAGGRNPPDQAFAFLKAHWRPGDAVCVGFYTADKPDMIEEDLRLLFA